MKKNQVEKEFCLNEILPLLLRMDFFYVQYYHGKREYGKDFVFSQINQFNQIINYGMQVKIGKLTKSMKEQIKTQITEAFDNPYKLKGTGENRNINFFYVLIKGDTTFNFDELRDPNLKKPNVFFLNLNDVELIKSKIYLNNVLNLKGRVSGVISEINQNINILEDLINHFSASNEKGSLLNLKTHNIENILETSIPDGDYLYQNYTEIWESLSSFNRLLGIYSKDIFKKDFSKNPIMIKTCNYLIKDLKQSEKLSLEYMKDTFEYMIIE